MDTAEGLHSLDDHSDGASCQGQEMLVLPRRRWHYTGGLVGCDPGWQAPSPPARLRPEAAP